VTTLILTRSDDAVVPELVTAALSHLGEHDVVRVDTDRYPDHLTLVDDGDDAVLGLRDGRRLRLSTLRAVWRRRCWPAARVGCDPAFAVAAAAQARHAFDAALSRLADEGATVVENHPERERIAEHKPRQLGLARRLGFAVPETMIGNDPAAVRAFVSRVQADGGRVVTKLLTPLSQTMRGDGPFVYTHTLRDDDIRALDDVRFAPQIFQRRVEKVLDVRVQVMGDVVVAGATACTSDDWRIDSSGRFERFVIDSAFADRCRTLCRAFGLGTGALDFVVDVQGAVFFLEVNPAGEWGFLERDLGQGLPEALARLLLGQP
jgi:glutathione synthase/RimK-type ligase-like ATP-grasp enzyme